MSFPAEVFLVSFLVLLLFGWDKLPELTRGVGMGASELRLSIQADLSPSPYRLYRTSWRMEAKRIAFCLLALLLVVTVVAYFGQS